jgi:hypothetical protein
LKLRFLALMCLWMPPQQIAAFHRWAGDAYNLRVRTGAMSGHGWSLLARGLKIFWHMFFKFHMRAIAQHAFIRAMGYPTFDQPCARPDTCPSTKKMQHLPNLPQSIYIYTHIFIYK